MGASTKKEFSNVTRIDWGHGDPSGEPLIGSGQPLPDQYKTVYKAQTLGEGTTKDQLSLMKRTQKPVTDKPFIPEKPQRERTMQFKENFPGGETEFPRSNPNGTRSMIADIGASLVHCTPDAPAVRRKDRK
jgi:hypothetical protein